MVYIPKRSNEIPLGTIRRAIMHQARTEEFRDPHPPSAAEAEENRKIAERETKEAPVKEIYDAIQLHPGRLLPGPDKPAAYYLVRKDGHRIFLTGHRSCFDFDDPTLHERLENEEDTVKVTCKNHSCKWELLLIMKVWTETESFKTKGCLIHCCYKCLTIVKGRERDFRNGKLQ